MKRRLQPFRGALCVFLALAFIAPQVGSAHQGDPNYRSEITSIEPPALAEGLAVEIQNFDDHVELVNDSGKDVVIEGYEGEPYVRISASGLVEVNLNSPTHYLNEDRYANVAVPERADAEAEPAWEEIDTTGEYIWHDHRSHYMGQGTPSQVTDESQRTKVFDYTIPITVGGKPAEIHGTLTWVGKQSGFPMLPFIALAVVVVAGAVVISIRRRRDDGDGGDDRGGSDGSREGEPAAGGSSEAW